MFHSSTICSFPKAQRSNKISSVNPGPGRYLINSPKITYGGKFGHDPKMKFKPNETPGVGSYNFNINTSSPKYTIAKNKHAHNMSVDTVTIDMTPGPGRYNINIQSLGNRALSPSYSIRGKPKDLKPSGVPGPGYYENQKENKIKGVTFGKNVRDFNPCETLSAMSSSKINFYKNQTPGPGRYAVNDKVAHTSGPSFSFPIQGKNGYQYKKCKPGPGEYDPIKSPISTAYSFTKTIKNIIFSSKDANTVGPGRYNTRTIDTNNSKGIKFSHAPRKLHSINNIPGPGEYEPKVEHVKNNASAFSISKSSKEFNFKGVVDSPGPGRYNINKDEHHKGISFGLKNELKTDNFPGPGQYEAKLDVTKSTIVSHTISKAKREELHKNKDEYNPGPGRYIVQDIKKTNSISFGKDKKYKDQLSETPGPGAYEDKLKSVRTFNGL